jgi:hypothetical protein
MERWRVPVPGFELQVGLPNGAAVSAGAVLPAGHRAGTPAVILAPGAGTDGLPSRGAAQDEGCYAADIQRETGRAVFDIVSPVRMAHDALASGRSPRPA